VIDVLLMPRIRPGEYDSSGVAGLSQEWKAHARPAHPFVTTMIIDTHQYRPTSSIIKR
jgi:hypothetical protein